MFNHLITNRGKQKLKKSAWLEKEVFLIDLTQIFFLCICVHENCWHFCLFKSSYYIKHFSQSSWAKTNNFVILVKLILRKKNSHNVMKNTGWMMRNPALQKVSGLVVWWEYRPRNTGMEHVLTCTYILNHHHSTAVLQSNTCNKTINSRSLQTTALLLPLLTFT